MSYRKFGVFILVALALTLSACTRSASPAPLLSFTPTSEFALPVGTPDTGMSLVEQFATQTALAQQPPLPGEETPTPEGGETPTPDLFGSGTGPTATPTISVVVSTPTPLTRPATYTLQKGEYPYCIARRYNVNPTELLTLNGLSTSQGSVFYEGLSLKIPQTGNPFPADRALLSHPTTYNTVSGDTIYTVACKFGDVDPLAIASSNNLAAPYSLTAGQSISIP